MSIGSHRWLWGLGLAVMTLVGCDPFHAEFAPVEPAVLYEAKQSVAPPEDPTELSVMTWNMKFGGGRLDFFFDCYGDRVLMKAGEVRAHIEALAEVIRAVEPDLVLVQEIDVNSRRVAFIDQLQLLLDKTDLNHAAYASQWRVDYVPSDGLGAIDSGSAILSRWPLRDAERVSLPLRTDQDALTRYFYLRRNYMRARVDLPGVDDLWVVNIHTDAYGKDGTKRRQIDRFHEELTRLKAEGALVIGGGDLNAIPPGSDKTDDFPDSVCTDADYQADDYSDEGDWLDALYRDFAPAISLEAYQEDNAPHFTHTVDGGGFWNRKLDYLFTSGAWVAGSAQTLQSVEQGGHDTMPLSDHAPVVGRLELP